MRYKAEITGTGKLLVGLQADREHARETLQDWVREAAQAAYAAMFASVPRQEGVLANAIEIRELTWHPGGQGGGGYWEIPIVVDPRDAPHGWFVLRGTGIHHDGGIGGGHPYRAKGNVMAFDKNGEQTVFTKTVKGQEAQTEWVELGQQAADRVLATFVGGHDLFTRR